MDAGAPGTLPVVALVGRPNVGKSTLFNALTRTRDAIVHDRPGVTRDRHHGVCRTFHRPFLLVDTGGLSVFENELPRLAARQAEAAIAEADLVVFVVDAREGLAAYDREIAAVLRAARLGGKGRIIAVMQPHRYTRLQSLFNDFSACLDDADIAIVTPVYSAGEAPIPGIDRDELASGLMRHGHPNVLTVDDEESLAEAIASVAKPGDLVVGLGAGTITDWINALPGNLQNGRAA